MLADYFSDIDASDSCINQTIGFGYIIINGTTTGGTITVSINNWTNANASALYTAESTGLVTSQSANITSGNAKAGQALTISTAGTLSMSLDSSAPVTSITPMSTEGVTLGIWSWLHSLRVETRIFEPS
jgi:hypothetical protein